MLERVLREVLPSRGYLRTSKEKYARYIMLQAFGSMVCGPCQALSPAIPYSSATVIKIPRDLEISLRSCCSPVPFRAVYCTLVPGCFPFFLGHNILIWIRVLGMPFCRPTVAPHGHLHHNLSPVGIQFFLPPSPRKTRKL